MKALRPVIVPWKENPHSRTRVPDPALIAPANATQIAQLNEERKIPAAIDDLIQKAIDRVDEPGFDAETPTQERAWQASPVWTSAGRPVPQLEGMFRGAACFLVCGGPSVRPCHVEAIARRGLLVAAVNNVAASVVRPNLWFACDDVRSFHESIWTDPAIMKFQKMKYLRKEFRWAGGDHSTHTAIRRWNGEKFAGSGDAAGDFPNVFGYFHRKGWDASRFFTDPTPTWGQPKSMQTPEQEYFLSIMLPAIWLLHWLGIRRLFLLGCDFKMRQDAPHYAFPQSGNVSGNNGLYRILDRRFAELRPFAESLGYEIANATGDGTDSVTATGGNLTAFRRVSLADAIREALTVATFPAQIVTEGHYIKG